MRQPAANEFLEWPITERITPIPDMWRVPMRNYRLFGKDYLASGKLQQMYIPPAMRDTLAAGQHDFHNTVQSLSQAR